MVRSEVMEVDRVDKEVSEKEKENFIKFYSGRLLVCLPVRYAARGPVFWASRVLTRAPCGASQNRASCYIMGMESETSSLMRLSYAHGLRASPSDIANGNANEANASA